VTSGRPSRRSVLLAAAASSLAACTGDDETPAPNPPAPPEPDELLRAEVADAERDLVALYEATAATHPALAAQVRPFTARHRRHLDAVEASGPVATPPAATAPGSAAASPASSPGVQGASPAGTSPPAPSPPAVPDGPADALAALRTAERTAAGARVTECVRAQDGTLAELLASIAACEAAHDVLLGAL